jgi:integrase
MRCNFYLRNPDPKKKGRTAIYLTATYRGQRCILYPGESIDKDDWDNKKFKPKPIAGNNALIGRLNRFEQLVRDTHDDLQKNINGIVPAKVLQKAVFEKICPAASEIAEAKPILITDFFQTLIDDSKSGVRRSSDDLNLNTNSVKPYTSAMNHFIEFQKTQKRKYFLTDINEKLTQAFIDYLNGEMALNTSAKYLTVFKLLISYAGKKNLIEFKPDFRVRREKSDSTYLNEQEIKEIMAITEFTTPLYEVVRDYFVIACNTGLRFSDFSALRLAHINDGFMEIDPGKTLSNSRSVTKVIVPVLPMFEEILSKYPNGFPKCPPNQVFNRYIKEIAEKVPSLQKEFLKKITRAHKVEIETYLKFQKVSAHTARRSFCTNMYLKGVPIITIMAMSGHKTQENFMKYIKADNRKHAELLDKLLKEEEAKRKAEMKKKPDNDSQQ